MPSFDVVSEVDRPEFANAVDQANRELKTRFDFRGVQSEYKLEGEALVLEAPDEFHLEQMLDILRDKMAKRKVDPRFLEQDKIEGAGKVKRQSFKMRVGLSQEIAKKMTKLIKDSKLKVQSSIQGDKVRITGKKRDDLQDVIALLRKDDTLNIPLDFNNFKD